MTRAAWESPPDSAFSGPALKERTVEAIARAFESAGVEFIAENGGGPGVRLAKRT